MSKAQNSNTGEAVADSENSMDSPRFSTPSTICIVMVKITVVNEEFKRAAVLIVLRTPKMINQ